MGEVREPLGESARDTAEALADAAELRGDTELAASLRAAGDILPNLTTASLILDTDIGGDPDDAVALVLAALHVPELALVTTVDEHAHQRASFARKLLDLCGRHDVRVVAGADLGNDKYRAFDGLVSESGAVAFADGEVAEAVATVCERVEGPVRWCGIGPMTNLARLVIDHRELADRLAVTQMGGAINYRRPERAEHNVRLDVEAARTVLRHKPIRWVMSDVTFTPDIEITIDHPLYERLAAPDAPAWASLIAGHMRQWFASFVPGTMQHDALTLTAALDLPFVDFGLERLAMDDIGRMTLDTGGYEAWISYRADYPAFNTWLDKHLTP